MMTARHERHFLIHLKAFYFAVVAGLIVTYALVPTPKATASTAGPQLVDSDPSVRPKEPVEPGTSEDKTTSKKSVQGIITDEYGHGL